MVDALRVMELDGVLIAKEPEAPSPQSVSCVSAAANANDVVASPPARKNPHLIGYEVL
jgi:hypothetical protein